MMKYIRNLEVILYIQSARVCGKKTKNASNWHILSFEKLAFLQFVFCVNKHDKFLSCLPAQWLGQRLGVIRFTIALRESKQGQRFCNDVVHLLERKYNNSSLKMVTACEKEPFVPPTKQLEAYEVSVPAPTDYTKGKARQSKHQLGKWEWSQVWAELGVGKCCTIWIDTILVGDITGTCRSHNDFAGT